MKFRYNLFFQFYLKYFIKNLLFSKYGEIIAFNYYFNFKSILIPILYLNQIKYIPQITLNKINLNKLFLQKKKI